MVHTGLGALPRTQKELLAADQREQDNITELTSISFNRMRLLPATLTEISCTEGTALKNNELLTTCQERDAT